jgi:3-methyladenine DNA glycosylase AlkD
VKSRVNYPDILKDNTGNCKREKPMEADEALEMLRSLANAQDRKGMKRVGINTGNALGISIYKLRRCAKEIGPDHALALQLWNSGIHEARHLACLIDEPEHVTPLQMDTWAADFDSWDICDQCCSNLFDRTPYAYGKAVEWSARKEEFVKRAGFVLMATLSVHDKKPRNSEFENFLPIIYRESTDERKYVEKAVNWALRQIGKRNVSLNKKAILTASRISGIDSKAARWIASDALRELRSEKVRERLAKKT